jgi:GGDEF domain-containing protein
MHPLVKQIQDAKDQLEALAKMDPELMASLKALEGIAKDAGLDPSHVQRVRTHLATDEMLRQQGVVMGNRAAYHGFTERTQRPGVHVRMDGNDFGSINKMHKFEVGNKAIVAFGRAIREAMDEAVGRKNGKVFRIGGDEFHAHVPDHAAAARFARSVRSKLEAIPPVGGTHNLSMCMGFGMNPDHAEAALIRAKNMKRAAKYPLGQAKTHVHSLIPGAEGDVPVDGDPRVTPPKEQMKTVPA